MCGVVALAVVGVVGLWHCSLILGFNFLFLLFPHRSPVDSRLPNTKKVGHWKRSKFIWTKQSKGIPKV